MNISVVGLGKLGVCTAACFACKGFRVIGIDNKKSVVNAVNSGKAPVVEPRLQELIDLSRGRLRATQDYEEAIRDTNITFLIVPTPSREDGHFSDEYLKDALTHLSLALKKLDKKYHIVAITSTISPGTTYESLIPFIESISGKKLNRDFGVAYNPEFIALGSVITDFLNPDMVLIGESDKSVGDKLEEIYKLVCENKPYAARMSITSAEIAKISLNSYITMKVSFANTLANICESISDADVDDITEALGADKRISPYYLKGGLSYGGPCFPRDNKAFAAFAQKYGIEAKLAKATDAVNKFQIKRLIRLVSDCVSNSDNKIVSILGLSYKPNTPVIDESPAIKLVEELLKKKLKVMVYDPLAMDNARAYFGDNILYASSIKECFTNSSTCVITTQADEFKGIDETYIHHPATIIDCWRMLDWSRLGERVKYIAYGKYDILRPIEAG